MVLFLQPEIYQSFSSLKNHFIPLALIPFNFYIKVHKLLEKSRAGIYSAFENGSPTSSIWSFLRFFEWNFRPKNRFFKIAFTASFIGQFWKIDFFAEHFTPKTSKMTKFRSRTKLFKRSLHKQNLPLELAHKTVHSRRAQIRAGDWEHVEHDTLSRISANDGREFGAVLRDLGKNH